MNDSSLLIIFTKNPEPGLVKTRLASSIGNEKALEVYETLRHHTASITATVDVEQTVYYSRFIPSTDVFLSNNCHGKLQAGEDLGERMLHAICKEFDAGFRHIVLIGTDCYELSSAILVSAFDALERSEAVIGPASDGGFYLIGMNRPIPELFIQRQWSTSNVLRETIDILQQFAITHELLPELSDIDTFDDLKKSGLWTHNE